MAIWVWLVSARVVSTVVSSQVDVDTDSQLGLLVTVYYITTCRERFWLAPFFIKIPER